MALFVKVSTMDDHVTTLVATRYTDHGSDPDSVNDYVVDRIVHDGVDPVGKIPHRYGDGALVLAQKMIEQANALDELRGER